MINILADGRNKGIGLDDKISPLLDHRPSSAGSIRFAKLHAHTLDTNKPSVLGKNLHRRCQHLNAYPLFLKMVHLSP